MKHKYFECMIEKFHTGNFLQLLVLAHVKRHKAMKAYGLVLPNVLFIFYLNKYVFHFLKTTIVGISMRKEAASTVHVAVMAIIHW